MSRGLILAAMKPSGISGRCGAFPADSSKLAADRGRAPGGPKGCRMPPERISKEPLGPVVH